MVRLLNRESRGILHDAVFGAAVAGTQSGKNNMALAVQRLEDITSRIMG